MCENIRGNPQATKKRDLESILKFIKATSKDILCDLGCGHGKLVIYASRIVESAYGIENHKKTYLKAKFNIKKSKQKNIKLIFGNYSNPKTLVKIKKCNIIFCINDEPLSTYKFIESAVKPRSYFITLGFPRYPVMPYIRFNDYTIMKTPFKLARSKNQWARSLMGRKSTIDHVYRKIRYDFLPKYAKEDIENLKDDIESLEWIKQKMSL